MGQPHRLLLIVLCASASLCAPPALCQAGTQRNVQQVSVADQAPVKMGPYYALVVGNSNYQYIIPPLKTPIKDADAVARVLREKYGFQTKIIHDATRMEIFSALSDYRRTLPADSNLLLYYAGHGYMDPETKVAYWFPVDAQRDNNANWISASDISSNISVIPSQHILIISDSCYSGDLSLNRDGGVRMDPVMRSAFLAKMMQHRSRTLLASGGNEPVWDGGAEGHSIFAAVLLDTLRDMDQEEFNASDIFVSIQHRVGGKSQQLPQYSSINNSGHDGGDFVFTRRQGTAGQDLSSSAHERLVPDDLGDEIASVLSRYQSAFEQKDVGALARLWPGMPAETRKVNAQFFDHADAVKLTYNMIGKPVVQADVATVKFSQELSFTTHGQAKRVATPVVTMTLNRATEQRGGAGWQIATVR